MIKGGLSVLLEKVILRAVAIRVAGRLSGSLSPWRRVLQVRSTGVNFKALGAS